MLSRPLRALRDQKKIELRKKNSRIHNRAASRRRPGPEQALPPMGGGWAAWPRCWPTRWRAVVLCMFPALTATATLTAEQEEELVTLIDA